MPEEQNGQELEQDVQTEVTTVETPAELPENVKEQTKLQFEKLVQHNKELAEENERLKTQVPKPQSALETLANPQMVQTVAPSLNQQQVEDVIKGLIDDNGELDPALLEKTLRQNNQQVVEAKAMAAQARQEAAQARSEVNKFGQDREVRIAHKAFPSVNPESSKYDPNFFKLVKNELLGAMYEGRKMTFVDACKDVSEVYSSKDKQEVKAKAVEEYKKGVASKSGLNPTGTSRPNTSVSNESLVEGTRKGDAASIAARLAKISS